MGGEDVQGRVRDEGCTGQRQQADGNWASERLALRVQGPAPAAATGSAKGTTANCGSAAFGTVRAASIAHPSSSTPPSSQHRHLQQRRVGYTRHVSAHLPHADMMADKNAEKCFTCGTYKRLGN